MTGVVIVGNSPGEVSSFVGRRREVSAVRRLLSKTRLLTLTGAGGVGKTRLALRAAETLRRSFRDGVELVELATLEDGDLLEPTVAAALGLRDAGSRPMTMLVDYLLDKRVLLVLDNCEHLLQECARLVDGLLRGAPRLRVLATSRQTLGVAGEQVMSVPSMSVPHPGDAVRDIARREAVRLFVERAASVRPGFAVDAANAAAVARLCQRLDGIPLAIELAAVRLRTLRVERLMEELDGRFEVLTGGSPAALPRHQTLRATMDWSFELCSPAERRLWSRLSIFAGGVGLETVEAVCSGDGIDRDEVFDLVAGLVDKSILSGERRETEVRYHMLDSVRAYGRERLTVSEERSLRLRYIDHYRRLVERHRLDRLIPEQLERYRTLQVELPNVRVALDLCLVVPGEAPTGLEIASMLWANWILAGSFTEGRHWLERGLGLVPEGNAARVKALWVDGLLALHQGDLAAAGPRLEECHALARWLGDEPALAFAVQTTGIAAFSAGDTWRGLMLLEDARARHRACGDLDAVGVNLFYAATYGSVEAPDRAAAFGEEFLAICEAGNAQVSRAYALFALGVAAWNQGDWCRTEVLMREAAAFRSAINDRWGLTQCLEVLAWTAGARGRHERAARMLGTAHALWQTMGASPTRLWPHVRAHEQCDVQARRALGERAFAAAFRGGAQLGLDRAVTYAIEDDQGC
ncbi:ATP-binding protein [Streptosporangium sp. NPDC000396]|uniref:ATP-binding protein n=1 Tax=Streptosporangium sp. NPDC000396 TaxID=3366185 RepID=UPI0036C916F1